MEKNQETDTYWLAFGAGLGTGALLVVVLSALLLALGGCAASRPAPEETVGSLNFSPCLDSLAALPPYLVPAPAGSSPRQRRRWQRSQAANLARAGHLPRTVKVKHSSVAVGAGAVAITRPAAAVAAGPQATATDNRQAGKKGTAATGPEAVASTARGISYWWLLLVVAGAGAWWQRKRLLSWIT